MHHTHHTKYENKLPFCLQKYNSTIANYQFCSSSLPYLDSAHYKKWHKYKRIIYSFEVTIAIFRRSFLFFVQSMMVAVCRFSKRSATVLTLLIQSGCKVSHIFWTNFFHIILRFCLTLSHYCCGMCLIYLSVFSSSSIKCRFFLGNTRKETINCSIYK